jgi:hypothetical protein
MHVSHVDQEELNIAAADKHPISRGEPFVAVKYDASSNGVLTDDLRDVLDGFVRYIRKDAVDNSIGLDHIEIRGLIDPEDDTTQVIVRAWTIGMGRAATQQYFYDTCGRMGEWLSALDKTHKDLFELKFILQTRCLDA